MNRTKNNAQTKGETLSRYSKSIIFMILVLISSIRAYSQEWEYRYDYVYEDGECEGIEFGGIYNEFVILL